MKTIELKGELRDRLGKEAAKKFRRQGLIPAILYGRGLKSLPLVVSEKEFDRATHTKAGGNVLITLKVEGSRTRKDTTCLVKQVQRDPVTDDIQHVDFAVVSLTEKIRVKVPFSVKDADQALGIKEGGVLDVVHHEIEVECLPTEIPERVEASIKDLKIGDAIHLKEIQFLPHVTPLLPADEVVVTIHPPGKEVVAGPPPAEAAAEPEVIEKGKKEKPEEEAPAAPEKSEKAEK